MTVLDLGPTQQDSISLLDAATPNRVTIWPGAGGAFQNAGDALQAGRLYIGTPNEVIKNPANSVNNLSIESQDGYLFASAKLNAHVAGNAYWDGTNWNRFDPAVGGSYLTVTPASGMNLYTAPAGANPLTNQTIKFSVDVNGNAMLAGGNLYLRNDNGVVLNWDGSYLHTNVNFLSDGLGWFRGRLITNNWDGGWSNNLGGTAYVQSHLLTAARFATNGWWDTGWANSLSGNVLVNGFVYQRASGSYRCWDNGDFTYSVGVAGSTLVQRDANGYIQNNYINLTADVAGGSPVYIAGQNGDNYLRWYPKAS